MDILQLAGYGAIILIVLLLTALVPWGFGEFHRTTKRERRMLHERAMATREAELQARIKQLQTMNLY